MDKRRNYGHNVFYKFNYEFKEIEYEFIPISKTRESKNKSKESWKDNLFNHGKKFKQGKKFLNR